jgi:hypothetical protein
MSNIFRPASVDIRHAEGTPLIPIFRSGTSTYPTLDSKGGLGIGTRSFVEKDQGFGPLCTHSDLSDPNVPECVDDTGCHPAYYCHPIGKVCVRKNNNDCGNMPTNPCWCYMHSDCADGTKMCSGTGRCVTPVIEVRNEMAEDEAEFRVHNPNCTFDNALAVDMFGASPWGRVNDSLHAHGLCSHRNWWEYNRTISMATIGSGQNGECNRFSATNGDYCELKGGISEHRWRFTKNQERYSKGGLFKQGVLFQEAHTCDRDYEHMKDFKSCVGSPGVTWWKSLDGGVNATVVYPTFNTRDTTYLNTSWLFRTYREYPDSSVRLRLGVMKHVNNPTFGFLGSRRSAVFDYTSYEHFAFKKCSDIQSCTVQTFTLYGHIVDERRFRTHAANQPLTGDVRSKMWTFTCGPYGYYDTVLQKCTLDLATAPLYRVLCYSAAKRASIFSQCSSTTSSTIFPSTESEFITEYCARFTGSLSVKTIDTLAYQFNSPTSFTPDGYVPTWAPNFESLRVGISHLINRFTDAFKAVQSYASSGTPDSATYRNALTCVQVSIQSPGMMLV